MKRAHVDRYAELRRLLARLRPEHELVVGSKRRRRGAPAHAVTPDITALRNHAASWVREHGVAHRKLADRPNLSRRLRGAPRTSGSVIVQVRHRARGRAQSPHSPKHLLVSVATGKIVGEQG